MNKVFLVLWFLLVGLAVEAQTETKQTVTVNGETVDKTVFRITFDGDDVVLVYTDNSTQRAVMDQVNISFFYTSAGIAEMVKDVPDGTASKVYNLNGQYVGYNVEQLPKGIYVVDERKMIVR